MLAEKGISIDIVDVDDGHLPEDLLERLIKEDIELLRGRLDN